MEVEWNGWEEEKQTEVGRWGRGRVRVKHKRLGESGGEGGVCGWGGIRELGAEGRGEPAVRAVEAPFVLTFEAFEAPFVLALRSLRSPPLRPRLRTKPLRLHLRSLRSLSPLPSKPLKSIFTLTFEAFEALETIAYAIREQAFRGGGGGGVASSLRKERRIEGKRRELF